MTRHFTPETENVEFFDTTKKMIQFEQTDLLQGMEKAQEVSCGI